MEQGDHQQQKKEEEALPPGFRFHPTDEELISYYLVNKIADQNFTGKAIADVDLNKSEPWELPGTLITLNIFFVHTHTKDHMYIFSSVYKSFFYGWIHECVCVYMYICVCRPLFKLGKT